MNSNKYTFISTVYNEQENIEVFLKSVVRQSLYPEQIIIVDGGSSDNTLNLIKNFNKKNKLNIFLLEKKGNRSVGRNYAIANARNKIILCSDAGCVLDKNWAKNIIKPFVEQNIDVVAGYYKGRADNIWGKCIIPYVLVMSNRLNPEKFLPATRSMAFRKKVWEELDGFDERLSHNEDYAFSQKLLARNKKITFVKTAIVEWLPPQTINKFARMIFRFALGDSQAGILRPKVGLIFLRYLIFIILLAYFVLYRNGFASIVIATGVILYLIWSIEKNYRYINDIRALVILPLLQITSDICVIMGTLIGALDYIKNIRT